MADVEGTDEGHGYGVRGTSSRENGSGVLGRSNSGAGVKGESDISFGVYGASASATGVGVLGESNNGFGVYGFSGTNRGVFGASASSSGYGVFGENNSGIAVYGDSDNGKGVFGESDRSIGVHGKSGDGKGVLGSSSTDAGVEGTSPKVGVRGLGSGIGGIGIAGIGNDVAVFGWGGNFAGSFIGNVDITGSLTVDGTKSFKIDHPLDPSNKYLYHSSVESPDMKNVYDGVVVLDDKGEAVVVLPVWFEALNKEFRYQLTPISAPGPNLYIAEEIKNHRFKIAGGSSEMKVCWQVTGIRQDAWAQANPLVIEQDKSENERGYYLHPEVHGYPAQKNIAEARYPEEARQFREIQENTV
jgi:hypothetical protein